MFIEWLEQDVLPYLGPSWILIIDNASITAVKMLGTSSPPPAQSSSTCRYIHRVYPYRELFSDPKGVNLEVLAGDGTIGRFRGFLALGGRWGRWHICPHALHRGSVCVWRIRVCCKEQSVRWKRCVRWRGGVRLARCLWSYMVLYARSYTLTTTHLKNLISMPLATQIPLLVYPEVRCNKKAWLWSEKSAKITLKASFTPAADLRCHATLRS